MTHVVDFGHVAPNGNHAGIEPASLAKGHEAGQEDGGKHG